MGTLDSVPRMVRKLPRTGLRPSSSENLSSLLFDSVWQAPCIFDLAQARKHLLVFFGNGISIRFCAKLQDVPVWALKKHKWVRRPRPAPMLDVVMEIFRARHSSAHLLIRNVRRIMHHVWDIGGNHHGILIGIYISPEDRRQHV